MTQNELLDKLVLLDPQSKGQRDKLVCLLVGHSRIVEYCFGYVYCARCGGQLGDMLGGSYDAMSKVIVNHECHHCAENYNKLTWRDKLFTPNPFKPGGLGNLYA